MTFTTPDDGGTYSGTSETIVKDASGNTLYDLTGTIYNAGDGLEWATGLTNIYIPAGANIYIYVKERNATNSKSFSGSWRVQNWQP
jgi:hypothetical protein